MPFLALWSLPPARTLRADSAPCAEAPSYSCCCVTNAEFPGPGSKPLTPPCIPLPSQNRAGNAVCSWMTGKRLRVRRCRRKEEKCSNTHDTGYLWVPYFIYSNWARMRWGNTRWTHTNAEAGCSTVAFLCWALFIHPWFCFKTVTEHQTQSLSGHLTTVQNRAACIISANLECWLYSMPEIPIKIIKIRSAATQWAAGFRSTARECPRQNSQRESGRQRAQIPRAGSSIPLTQFCLKCWPQAVREQSSKRASKKKEKKTQSLYNIARSQCLTARFRMFLFSFRRYHLRVRWESKPDFHKHNFIPSYGKKLRNRIIQNPECSLKSLNVVFWIHIFTASIK